MKTYGTFDTVPGLQPCRKRPVIVHAIKILEPFRVNSLEGDYKQGKPGDYLMKGIDGELYICDGDIFERSYDFIDPPPAEATQELPVLGFVVEEHAHPQSD